MYGCYSPPHGWWSVCSELLKPSSKGSLKNVQFWSYDLQPHVSTSVCMCKFRKASPELLFQWKQNMSGMMAQTTRARLTETMMTTMVSADTRQKIPWQHSVVRVFTGRTTSSSSSPSVMVTHCLSHCMLNLSCSLMPARITWLRNQFPKTNEYLWVWGLLVGWSSPLW